MPGRLSTLRTCSSIGALAIVVGMAAPAAADTWNSGSGIIYTNTGVKVGVDTAVPTGTFEVQSPSNQNRPALLVNQASNFTPAIADFQRSGSSKLKIDISGRVGIGLGTTGTASQALHVVGNGYLTGFLQADGGLRVKLWSMEVPDYVFDAERYKLTSLEDLDTFIKRERHLPEMPSAAELKEGGMDVAEMNLRLLKKVEELTLYTIEQDKKIKALAAKVDGAKVDGRLAARGRTRAQVATATK